MKRLFALSITTVFLFFACQKELSLSGVAGTNQPKNVLAYFAAKQPAPQTFTMPASGGFIKGAKGTGIYLPANAFVTLGGTPVNGDVTITMKELQTVADIVLNRRFTQSGNRPLETGGAFFISAYKGNQKLRLASGVTLLASLPSNSFVAGMQVFNGKFENDSTMADSTFDWVPNNTAANSITPRIDSLQSLYQFIVQCDSLGWVNCDKFIDQPLFEIKAKVSNGVNDNNSAMMIHLTGTRTVVSMYLMGDGYVTTLPESTGTIIAASRRDNKLFTAFLPVDLAVGKNYSLTLAEMTEAEFIKKLNALK